MDWSKAKNILIIALIATNVFLLVTYLNKNKAELPGNNQEVILAVLENKNIFIDTKIPQKYEKMPVLSIEYTSIKNKTVNQNLKQSIYDVGEDADDDAYKGAADRFMKDCGIRTENLAFDKVYRDEKTAIVQYKNCYKKIAIGESYVQMIFEDGKPQDITRKMVSSKAAGKKKLNIISPEEALLIFMSEKDSSEVVHVENLQLVFWINDTSFDGEALVSDTAFPAWEISYNGSRVKYIEAYKT